MTDRMTEVAVIADALANDARDYESQYNNRARVPEHPQIIAAWRDDAAAFRARVAGPTGTVLPTLDIPYGEKPRQRYDLFEPAPDAGGAMVVFIHGGYWQALDRTSFSHLAAGPLAHGVPVVVAGYDLCPAVSVSAIVDQMRALCIALWVRHSRRLVIVGHSAGGHLAAELGSTDWNSVSGSADVPADLIGACYAISGLFDLEPLVSTSINTALALDLNDARAASPVLKRPREGLIVDAVVGAHESVEYRRQSTDLAKAWQVAGAYARAQIVPHANHFTIIAPLADPQSAMTQRVVSLTR